MRHGYLLLLLLSFVGWSALALPTPQNVEDIRAPILEGLGSTHHEITTKNAYSQMFFDQGLILHYGFNHAEAIRSFKEAARLDPTCAMCYMGVALALGPNLNAPMNPDDLLKAQSAILKAQDLAQWATQKEQMYINAVAKRYAGGPEVNREQLDAAYAEAMAEVVKAYPNDPDAGALYAESLMVRHPWDFWTSDYEPKPWTPKILQVLEGILDQHPNHVFANHLYIHAVEASAQPERAMASAERLGSLAPGIGHLVHMPAHIYIRTGLYHKGSQANLWAIAADEAYLEQVKAQGLYTLAYVPHNYHFLWATATLEGRSELAMQAAKGTAERVDKTLMDEPGLLTLQHYWMIPLYAMVSFGQWDQILATPKPQGERLYPLTLWHYARGMAEVAKGNLKQAEEHLAFVQKASKDQRLREVTIWELNTTQDLAKIAAEILAGDLAQARGQMKEAITHYRKAAQQEDQLNYDEPSSWATPTRWYLGAALLKAESFKEAEKVYRENLKRYPKNGWALKGLHLALKGQGKKAEAKRAYTSFLQAWKYADVELKTSRF